MDGGDLLAQVTRAVPEPFAAHPHLQRAPEDEAQEADQQAGFDPLGLVVKDRAQAQVAFADAEGFLGLSQPHVPTPELGAVTLGAVGAQEVGAVRGPDPIAALGAFGDLEPAGAALRVAQKLEFEQALGGGGTPEPAADAPLDRSRVFDRAAAQAGGAAPARRGSR